MDDILLTDSDEDSLGKKMFEENSAVLGITNHSWKNTRGKYINYIGYKIGLQKI